MVEIERSCSSCLVVGVRIGEESDEDDVGKPDKEAKEQELEQPPRFVPGVVDERYLVVVDKLAATPPGYPRKPGIPGRKPL